MPIQGQTIVNPINGDAYEFLETSASSGGAKVVMRATIRSRGQLVPKHYHVYQDETFEIISGKLTVWLNGQTTTYTAGDKITLPKNIPHNHYNEETEAVVYVHSVSPGLDFDYLIENLAGLAADGKSKNGKYGLVQELVALKYLDSKSYLADIPQGVQQVLMNVIAPVARLFGYRAIYKKYSGIEK
jgi:quercetin dioxygenase-like cupin family protein